VLREQRPATSWLPTGRRTARTVGCRAPAPALDMHHSVGRILSKGRALRGAVQRGGGRPRGLSSGDGVEVAAALRRGSPGGAGGRAAAGCGPHGVRRRDRGGVVDTLETAPKDATHLSTPSHVARQDGLAIYRARILRRAASGQSRILRTVHGGIHVAGGSPRPRAIHMFLCRASPSRCSMNQARASAATCSSAPGSSNRCVAPGTISSRTSQRICALARSLSAITGTS
jgi:hypothetical protein